MGYVCSPPLLRLGLLISSARPMVIRIPTVRAVVAFSPTTLSDLRSSPESFANLDLVVTTSTQVFKVSYAVVGLYWVCFCLLLRCTVLQASRFAPLPSSGDRSRAV